MKTQQMKGNNNQGTSTADRNKRNQHDEIKQKGISNAGGQRSDQTSAGIVCTNRSIESINFSVSRKHLCKLNVTSG